jgi:predicted Zn-dependent protease
MRASISVFRFLPLAAVILLAGCAVNPATGARQIMLVSEGQEIQMGRQADGSVIAQYGLYPDDGLQAYVGQLGATLAAKSERPDLPWTFRVVDDPIINAFALPGGFIYVTRGIMGYFNSEAELVSVLGHEIGHVTARHSAQQMTQQQLAQVGLVAGAILLPSASDLIVGVGGAGLQVLFLKFSRDDETEADLLGLRYMVRGNWDANEMPHVYAMLGRVSTASGGDRLPTWLSTHPDPENREQTIKDRIVEMGASGGTIGRDDYLRRLDGMVFGANPREGFFREQLFLHPDFRFQLEFPRGWKTVNLKTAVAGQSPNEDAIVQLTLADAPSAPAAADAFLAQQGVQGTSAQLTAVNGLTAARVAFRATTEQGTLRGLGTFIEYDGNVYQLLGFTPESRWSTYERLFGQSHGSFGILTDATALAVQPLRLSIVRLDRAMTIEQFHQRYPSQAPVETIALINGVQTNTTLSRGTRVKRVVGGPLP